MRRCHSSVTSHPSPEACGSWGKNGGEGGEKNGGPPNPLQTNPPITHPDPPIPTPNPLQTHPKPTPNAPNPPPGLNSGLNIMGVLFPRHRTRLQTAPQRGCFLQLQQLLSCLGGRGGGVRGWVGGRPNPQKSPNPTKKHQFSPKITHTSPTPKSPEPATWRRGTWAEETMEGSLFHSLITR